MATSTERVVELTILDLPAHEKVAAAVPGAKATRVFAELEFTPTAGDRLYDVAVVDTGAPMSLVPLWLWKQCPVEILGEHEVKGIALPPVRPVPTFLGRIGFHLLSKGEPVLHLRPIVHLARSDSVPLLLGIHEVLSRFRLVVDFATRSSHLVERKPGDLSRVAP